MALLNLKGCTLVDYLKELISMHSNLLEWQQVIDYTLAADLLRVS